MSALGHYIHAEDVLLDPHVTSEQQLFDSIGSHVARIGGLPAHSTVAALLRRESAGSTAVGLGVAIPHARIKGIDHVRALYIRLKSPLDSDAPDGSPVGDVFVLLVPDPATEVHLEILALTASLFSNQAFRAELHGCQNSEQVKSPFDRWGQ